MPDLQRLQFLISKNPSNYITEVKQQCQQFTAYSQLLQLNPTQYDDDFAQNIHFLTKISKYYPQLKELNEVQSSLLDILLKNAQTLHQDFRQTIFVSIITLVNQKILKITPQQYQQLMNLLLIKDKDFRHRCQKLIKILISSNQQLFKLTIQEIRKTRNLQIQTRLLPVLTQCYYDEIWKEERAYQDVVNLIADLLTSTPDLRVAEICASFLLQSEDQVDDDSDSEVSIEDYQENDQLRQEKLNKLYAELRDITQAFKTDETARRRKVLKLQSEIRKIKFKEDNKQSKTHANQQKILDYIYNVSSFVEKITNKYLKNSCQFQFRLKIMEIIAECADVFKIQTPGFFTLLQKYLQPKQTDVQQIMYAMIKAVNEQQNPQEIYQTVQTVIFNFLNGQNTDDEMIVGINYITNICKRNHEMLTETEEGIETLNLIFSMTTTKGVLDMHETEKGVKTSILTRNSVVQAARELLNFYREVNPLIINKKYQNKESALKVKQLKQQQGLSVSEENEIVEEQDEKSNEESSSCDECQKPSRYQVKRFKKMQNRLIRALGKAKRNGRKLYQHEIDDIRKILDLVVDEYGNVVEGAYIDSDDEAVYVPKTEIIEESHQIQQITPEHKQFLQECLEEQNEVEFEEFEELSEYEDPQLHILTQEEIKERQQYNQDEKEKFAPIDLNSFQKKHKMTKEEKQQHTAESRIPTDHKNHKWDRKQEKMLTKRLSRTNKEKQADKPLLMVLRSETIRKKQARARWQKIAAAKKGGRK